MKKEEQEPSGPNGRLFYRIMPSHDGLVDIWLTPGEPVPLYDNLTGRIDYNFRVMAVRGINPEDPQYGGDLEGYLREHYYAFTASAEEIEI